MVQKVSSAYIFLALQCCSYNAIIFVFSILEPGVCHLFILFIDNYFVKFSSLSNMIDTQAIKFQLRVLLCMDGTGLYLFALS